MLVLNLSFAYSVLAIDILAHSFFTARPTIESAVP